MDCKRIFLNLKPSPQFAQDETAFLPSVREQLPIVTAGKLILSEQEALLVALHSNALLQKDLRREIGNRAHQASITSFFELPEVPPLVIYFYLGTRTLSTGRMNKWWDYCI